MVVCRYRIDPAAAPGRTDQIRDHRRVGAAAECGKSSHPDIEPRRAGNRPAFPAVRPITVAAAFNPSESVRDLLPHLGRTLDPQIALLRLLTPNAALCGNF